MQVLKRPIPYNLGSNSAVIWWETDSTKLTGHGLWVQRAGMDEVYYEATSKFFRRKDGTKVISHSIEVLDIAADTFTTLRVAGPGYLGTVSYSVGNAAADENLSFMVANSVEGNFADLDYLIANKHTSTNAMISCGNLVDLAEKLDYVDWIKVYTSLSTSLESAKGVVLTPTEKGKTTAGKSLLPTSNNQSPYFASTIGPCRFISLDTSNSGRRSLGAGGSQVSWFLNEVKSNAWKSASFRIILGSVPPVTSLWSEDGTYLKGEDRFLKSNLMPLIKVSGANMCIFGGGHSYQRGVIASGYKSFEDLPIHYVICSGFNSPHTKEVGDWKASSDPSFLVKSSDRHYVRMDVSLGTLTLIAREWTSDSIIDQLSLSARNLE